MPFCPGEAQRILALYFPFLSTDRIARQKWGPSWRSRGRPDHPAIVCAGREKNAMRLTALDSEAKALGLKRGQGVTEARAMAPDIDVAPFDPEADRAFLDGIADWCDRYTPLVAINGPDGIYLDITGSSHLFGGEKALMDDILSRLFQIGIEARGAISSAPGLSHAVARHGREAVIAPEEAETILASMPVIALRLETSAVELLVKAGLRKIGDLIGQPRAPLARRFGPMLLIRLDQALGLEEEPISPRRPVAPLSSEKRLSDPVGDEETIMALVARLAANLKTSLEARGEGGRLFELMLFRVDGKVFRLQAGASSPIRDMARVSALFKARLAAVHDDLDAGYGFETLRLNVLQAAPFQQEQTDFQGDSRHDDAFSGFVDQMTARFGQDVLAVPLTFASHVPERAGKVLPLSKVDDLEALETQPAPASEASRPIRLFAHPEPVETVAEVPEGPPITFRWRRAFFKVVRAEGPERISPEWWIDGEDAKSRDYFRIEDEAGRRYWLYREGLYERETPNPRWFMHGVFA
jgi:protein ImuB